MKMLILLLSLSLSMQVFADDVIRPDDTKPKTSDDVIRPDQRYSDRPAAEGEAISDEGRGIPGLNKIGFVDFKINSDGMPVVGAGARVDHVWFVGVEGQSTRKSFTDKTDPSIPHDYHFRADGRQWRITANREFVPWRVRDLSIGVGGAIGKDQTKVSYDFYNVVNGSNVEHGMTTTSIESVVGVVTSDFRYTPPKEILGLRFSVVVGFEYALYREHDSYTFTIPDGSSRTKQISEQNSLFMTTGMSFYF